MELSSEFQRLHGLYDTLDPEDLRESLIRVHYILDESHFVASKKADNVFHAQGKSRSISNGYLAPSSDELRDDYINESFKSQMIVILNRYIGFIRESNDSYKMKSLIVFLMIKNLYSITSELKFSEDEFIIIDKILEFSFKSKEELLNSLIQYFDNNRMPLHSKRTKEIGYSILEMRTDKSLARNYSDLVTEARPDDMYEFILGLRSKFLSVSTSPKIQDYLEIAELASRTFRTKKNQIIDELQEFVTESEVNAINNLILNY
jgi:hypothetical protein